MLITQSISIYGNIEEAIVNSDYNKLIQIFENKMITKKQKIKYLDLSNEIITKLRGNIEVNNIKQPLSIESLLGVCGFAATLVSVVCLFDNYDSEDRNKLIALSIFSALLSTILLKNGLRKEQNSLDELEQKYFDALAIKQFIYDLEIVD